MQNAEADQPMPKDEPQEADVELLELQRRKSMPVVLIQEFVEVGVENEVEDLADSGSKGDSTNISAGGLSGKHIEKEVTHIQVEKFEDLALAENKPIGMHEMSPLERMQLEN